MIDVPGINDFTDLADVPHSYFGQASKFLKVNITETGIDFGAGSGGGGVSFETPVGAVNGVNTAYTVTNTPKYIVQDGVTYFSGNGYTIAGSNLTTDIPPVGFIQSAY